MIRVGHNTSIVVAFSLCVWLKVLNLFHLINWHPTSFLKTTTEVAFFRYILLFLLIYLIVFFHYMLFSKWSIPLSWPVALFIGVFYSYFLLSWISGSPIEGKALRSMNVPFTVTLLVVAIFVIETAQFHLKANGGNNRLPYDSTVIK